MTGFQFSMRLALTGLLQIFFQPVGQKMQIAFRIANFNALFFLLSMVFGFNASAAELKYYGLDQNFEEFERFLEHEYEPYVDVSGPGSFLTKSSILNLFKADSRSLMTGQVWTGKPDPSASASLTYSGQLSQGGLCERWQKTVAAPTFLEALVDPQSNQLFTQWRSGRSWDSIQSTMQKLTVADRSKLSPMEKLCFSLNEPQMCLNEYRLRGPISPFDGKPRAAELGFCLGARMTSVRVDEPKCPVAVAEKDGTQVSWFQPNDIKMLISAAITRLSPFLQFGGVAYFSGVASPRTYWPSVVMLDVALRLGVSNPNLALVVDNFMTSIDYTYNKLLVGTYRETLPVRRIESREAPQILEQIQTDQYGSAHLDYAIRAGTLVAQDVVVKMDLMDSVSAKEANLYVGNARDRFLIKSYSVPVAYTLYVDRSDSNKYVAGCFRPNREGSRCYEAADNNLTDAYGQQTQKVKIITFAFGRFATNNLYPQAVQRLRQLGISAEDCRSKRFEMTDPQQQACQDFDKVDHVSERHYVQTALKMAEYSSYVYDQNANRCRHDLKPLDLKASIAKRPIEVIPGRIRFVHPPQEVGPYRQALAELFNFRDDLPDLTSMSWNDIYKDYNSRAREYGGVESSSSSVPQSAPAPSVDVGRPAVVGENPGAVNPAPSRPPRDRPPLPTRRR